MTLNTVDAGKEYRLVACDAPGKTRSKLETLGLVPGERINVIQSTPAGLIIEVKHSRLAIAHDLAGSLIVS
jgi:ferrous iron transport protein A